MFLPIFLIFCSISSTFFSAAYPLTPSYKRDLEHSTRHVKIIGRGLRVETFHPKSKFQTFGKNGLAAPKISAKAKGDPLKLRTSKFISSHLGLSSNHVSYKAGYTVGSTKYAYAKQSYHNISFANAVANVAFREDTVVAFGSSFIETNQLARLDDPKPNMLPVFEAVKKAEQALDGTYNGVPTSLEYLVQPHGEIALTRVIQVQNKEKFTWHEAFVDAYDGSLLSVTDFVSHATYTVLPINKQVLTEGQELIKDPEDSIASPWGWHFDGFVNSTDTSGNNVIAFTTLPNSTLHELTNQTSPGLVFSHPYDTNLPTNASSNRDSARINAFYILNVVHDVAYRYGFTEGAFNFQNADTTTGSTGKAGDPVLVSVQDPSGVNNAFFATPPDGQAGICRLFIWNQTSPSQDSALENDIPIHEMMHGISNRMTGGGTGRCLSTLESSGLGEGWSDALAGWFKAKPPPAGKDLDDYVVGRMVSGNQGGIRTFPYSTDPKVNPLRYSSIRVRNMEKSHEIGEIWANMLHNMLSTLISRYGFAQDAATNPDRREGNVVFLHLMMDALALQPCNPTFVDARNAWLQADIDRYGGANKCLIWKTFAARGLGVTAQDYVDSFEIPRECANENGGGGGGVSSTATGTLSASQSPSDSVATRTIGSSAAPVTRTVTLTPSATSR